MPPTTVPPAARPRLAPLPMARWAQWLVSLAVLALIGVSLGSYFYHRRQLEAMAARHLRLLVAGPSQLQPGAGAAYSLISTRVTGERWPVPIEWSLSTADGKLVDHKESTDSQGRLIMNVPEMALPTRPGMIAQLGVRAGGDDNAVKITLPLIVRSPQHCTYLEVDRSRYRSGETVYYRSLTVDRQRLVPCRTLPLEFEIVDPKSAPLADSQWTGLTDHGVGNGSFRLPVSLAPGAYALVARGADKSTAEQRLRFDVVGTAASETTPKSADVGKNGGKPALRIDFFPEGGALSAGLENRVYFFAHDDQGQPVEIRGKIVNVKGDSLANVKSVGGGRGRFNIVPDATESYRVKIVDPPGISVLPALPSASREQRIAIAVDQGVLAPGAPLDVSLRAAKENVPLVVTASDGGLIIGQQLLVTPAPATAKATPLTIPLSESAAGVIRVTVYDYSTSPPTIVAERFVFRQARGLVVRAVPPAKPTDDLQLSIQKEKGQPVAATVCVTLLGRDESSSPAAIPPQADLLHALLTDDLPDKPAFAGPALTSAAAVELALGCQKPKSSESTENAPLVYDNLDEVRSQYEAALSDYRVLRSQAVNSLVMLSFFGGFALALLVTMLILLRIVWGGRLWMPALGAVICCATVTTVLIELSHMQTVETSAVGFATNAQTPHAAAARPATPPSDSPLRRLAEKLAKFGPDAEELKVDRFPVQQYTTITTNGTPATEQSGKPLAWYPLLTAGSDGRVVLPGVSAAAAKNLRVMVEAEGDGRVESCELVPIP
jgi:hypothetical protein